MKQNERRIDIERERMKDHGEQRSRFASAHLLRHIAKISTEFRCLPHKFLYHSIHLYDSHLFFSCCCCYFCLFYLRYLTIIFIFFDSFFLSFSRLFSLIFTHVVHRVHFFFVSFSMIRKNMKNIYGQKNWWPADGPLYCITQATTTTTKIFPLKVYNNDNQAHSAKCIFLGNLVSRWFIYIYYSRYIF